MRHTVRGYNYFKVFKGQNVLNKSGKQSNYKMWYSLYIMVYIIIYNCR